MNATLWRLLLLSIRGRIVRRLRMLRQPKYLVGFLVGVAYVGFWIWHADPRASFAGHEFDFANDLAASVHVVAALGLALFLSIVWMLPWGRLGLPLREAELLMLLPAPLTRRQIIRYAIVKGQAPILISSLVLSLLTGTGRFPQQARYFVGVWLLLSLLNVSKSGRALFLLRQRELGRAAALGRRSLLAAGIALYWGLVGWFVLRTVAPMAAALLRAQVSPQEVLEPLARAAGHGPGHWLLVPFLWLTAPVLARGWIAFGASLLPAAALLILGQEAVARSRASFEEAALHSARQVADRRSRAWRYVRLSKRARRHNPFALPPTGRPEVAIPWKNLQRLFRTPLRRIAGWGVGALVAVALLPAVVRVPEAALVFLGTTGLGCAGFLPLIVILGLRIDFQSELRHLEMVRTWPVAARRFAAAEVFGPAAMATAAGLAGGALYVAAVVGGRLQARLLGTGAHSLFSPGTTSVLGSPVSAGVAAGIGLVPLLVAGSALMSALRNLGVLAFPAWVGLGVDAPRGMAATGQRLLLGLAMILGVALGLVPAAAVVGVLALVQWAAGIPWSVFELPVVGLLAAVPLGVEVALLITLAGQLWSKLDPSREILE